MQTYTLTYLDDDDCYTLDRCGGVRVVGKDDHGREYEVGHYLAVMAEHRHCSLKHYQTAMTLIGQALLVLDPMSSQRFWDNFEVPHTDLLADQSARLVEHLCDAYDVCLRGASLATEPEQENN